MTTLQAVLLQIYAVNENSDCSLIVVSRKALEDKSSVPVKATGIPFFITMSRSAPGMTQPIIKYAIFDTLSRTG
jgi:hypothetical protein